jgi:hypothetical protein
LDLLIWNKAIFLPTRVRLLKDFLERRLKDENVEENKGFKRILIIKRKNQISEKDKENDLPDWGD